MPRRTVDNGQRCANSEGPTGCLTETGEQLMPTDTFGGLGFQVGPMCQSKRALTDTLVGRDGARTSIMSVSGLFD